MAVQNSAFNARTALSKKEATRLAKLAKDTLALRSLLQTLPRVDPIKIELAVDALTEAVDEYMASKPIVDSNARRSAPKIKEARASLAALDKHLVRARDALRVLLPDALNAIVQVTKRPAGTLTSEIEKVRGDINQALNRLNEVPDKVPDYGRTVLAYRVAVVFRDILNLKPTSTSEKQLTANMATARGGAAYARVLSATLKAAGVVNYDPGPLISSGLRLLKDPAIPQRE